MGVPVCLYLDAEWWRFTTCLRQQHFHHNQGPPVWSRVAQPPPALSAGCWDVQNAAGPQHWVTADMKQTTMQITDVCPGAQEWRAKHKMLLYIGHQIQQGQEVGGNKSKESVRVYAPTAKSETNNSYRFLFQHLETRKQMNTDGNDKMCEENVWRNT